MSNLNAVDLAAVPAGGTIHEELMDKIFDISPVDRPFCDSTGTKDSGNNFTEWVTEKLEVSNPNNARVEGSSSAALNDTVTGERVGNYHQIASKTVRVSDRGRSSNTVDTSDELIRQLVKRMKSLKRDEEASYLSRNIAIGGDGVAVAGVTAGVGSWIGATIGGANTVRGAGGSDATMSGPGGVGGYVSVAPVVGAKRALKESEIKSVIRDTYLAGGDIDMAISTPQVIELFSDYLFKALTVAKVDSHVDQGNRTNNASGNGKSGGGVTAQGSINMYISNYAALELIPDRFQPEVAAGTSDLYLIDSSLWERSYLQGFQTKELSRDGLAENREITVDFALCSLNETGSGAVCDIDTTLVMTA